MGKRLLAAFLCLSLTGLLCVPAYAAEVPAALESRKEFEPMDVSPHETNAASRNVLVSYAVEGGNITFDPADGAIKDCDETVTKADIPSSIDGMAVTSIGSWAFSSCSDLTSVTIPDSVTSIGYAAFDSCSALTSITIPDGVTSIEAYSFLGCNSLTSVTIPNSVTSIGEYAFRYCSGLTGVTIPNSVTIISDLAFQLCKGLTSVTIPNSVTSIRYSVFQGCSGLTSVTIPDSVTRIEALAFDGCKRLTDVYYSGSETQWNAITIEDSKDTNKPLASAVIHYNYNGDSPPSPPAEDPAQIPEGRYLIRVVDPNGKPISGATVSYAAQSDVTDQDGAVLFNRFTVDEPLITASLSGYITWSNKNSNWRKSSDYQTTIILYPTSYSGLMLQSAWYNNKVDLLTKTKKLNLKSGAVGDLTPGNFSIICSALDASLVSEYQLWQGKVKIASSSNGSFSLNVTNGFVKGGNCFVRVIGADGRTADNSVNLTFVENTVRKETGISILKDKISVTVADNVPFLGGSTFNVGGVELLPAEIQATEDKFYIGFNANIWDSNDSSGPQTKEKFENFKKSLQTAMNANVALGKRGSAMMNSLMKREPDFKLPGGSVKFNVIGYAEANWGSSTATGEIYIVCSAVTPTFGFTTWVVVAPVTVHISGSLELKMGAKVSYNWESSTFNGEIPITLTVGLEAFGGVGVGKAMGAGAYGSANLAVDAKVFYSPFFKSVDLTGALGVKAYVGPFEYKKAFAHNTWRLYTANTVKSRALENEGAAAYGIYRANGYERQDLNYLSAESDWYGSAITPYNAAASTTLRPLQEGTYRNAQPMMIAANDGLYATLLRADSANGEIYAAATKFNGASWSEPVRLDCRVSLDSAPKLLETADGNILTSYIQTNPETDTSTLINWANNQTLVAGTLDRKSLAFTKTASFSGIGYVHDQTLAIVNGTPALVWLETAVETGDDVLMPSANTIKYALWDGAGWSEAKTLTAVNHPIRQLTAGEAGIACNVDTDDDIATTEDAVLTLYDLNGDTAELATGVTGNVTYGTLPDETTAAFLWNGDNCLISSSGKTIPAEGITKEYAVTADRIYYSAAGQTGAHLTTVPHDGGTWSGAVTLTGGDRYLENLNIASWDGVDYLMGMDTLAEISQDNVEDAKNLVWSAVMPSSDLRLDGVSYDPEGLTAGASVPVTLDIINAGDHKVENITIETDGTAETLPCSLNPGEILEVERVLTCPGELTEHSFTVYETGMDDFTPDNNTGTVHIGYPDLAIDLQEKKIGTYHALEAIITNEGVSETSGAVRITDETGNPLLEQNLEAIAPGDAVVVTRVLESSDGDGDYTATVISGVEELYSYNNESVINISAEIEPAILDATINGQILKVSLNAAENGTVCCAEYDADGKLITVYTQPVTTGKQVKTFSLKESGTGHRKIFLLNQKFTPQCDAKTI